MLLVTTAGATAGQDVRHVTLPELLGTLPILFKAEVATAGQLRAFGDTAALEDGGAVVMVDLRALDPALAAELNRDCPQSGGCPVTVAGTVAHIQGEGISELGLLAETVELTGEPR